MDFVDIKRRMDTLLSRKARIEGQIIAIKKSWKDTYGTDDVEAVKKLLDDSKSKLAEMQKRQEEYIKKADELLTAAGV